ncbi:MAG: transporter substrate-binding domain-containing protein, partial [Vreelandella alkaliphila]|uniref:transporter substrate-binding domain-containing protein n=2 Tax=Vreelandella alkaliphila TaxID=272774 RepID=UPI003F96D13E
MFQTLSCCGPRSSSTQKGALCVLAHVMSGTLLLAGCLATTPVSAETLTVGVYHNPPKLFADDEGRPRGVLGDLLQAIAKEEQWQLESLQCDFQHCLTLLEQGDIDLLPDVAWSEERAQRIAFHEEPVMHSWSQLYQREGAKVSAIFDLEQQRVAVVSGSVQQSYLAAVTERFDINVTWLPVSSFARGFQAVADDEADLVAANHLFGDWRAHDYGLSDTPVIFQPARLFYAASPQLPDEILSRIDDVLRRWKQDKDSAYYETLGAWRAMTGPSQLIPTWVWWGISLLILLLMLALLGNVLLKRRMRLSREQLNTHEVLLATILDSVDAYIYIKSSSLKYRYVNRRMSELFNRPKEAIVGKYDDDFFNAESAKAIKKVDQNILDSGKKVTIEEHNMLQGEEHVRTFLSIKMPLTTAPGEAPCLCGISTELTEYLEMQSKTHRLAFYDAWPQKLSATPEHFAK